MPPYELRVRGKPAGTFETESEAVAAASAAIKQDADSMPEVLDVATGQAAAPAADRQEQETYAGKVGF